MIGNLVNGFTDFLRIFRNDKQCLLLVFVVGHVKGLGKRELENDRVQSGLPSEEQSGDNQQRHIKAEYRIPSIDTLLSG